NMRSFGNFCVASVLGSSCTTCTLRSCASYAPINSSKYLCFERSLIKDNIDINIMDQGKTLVALEIGR
ncbi:MAG: hypothetical protein LBJ16_03015, partial [Holosporaceae bacterium]|nr:hypothetical protein [Holosporaceae bacterium]